MNTEWKPIESAPQTGRTLLLGYWNSHGKWRTVRGQWMSLEYIAEHWEDPDDAEAGWFETAVEADDAPNCWPVSPSHWQPMPAAPCQTCNGHGAVGNILNAEPCPDCSSAPTSHPIPTGATGEDERQAFEAWFTRNDVTKDMAARAVRLGPGGNYVLMQTYTAWEVWQAARASVAAPAAGDALDALRELVACDNIKKQIASRQVCVLETDDDVQELDGLMSDLARRQPAAWEAAHAAIAQQSQRKEA